MAPHDLFLFIYMLTFISVMSCFSIIKIASLGCKTKGSPARTNYFRPPTVSSRWQVTTAWAIIPVLRRCAADHTWYERLRRVIVLLQPTRPPLRNQTQSQHHWCLLHITEGTTLFSSRAWHGHKQRKDLISSCGILYTWYESFLAGGATTSLEAADTENMTKCSIG
jgi:hypothetical protein